ncbi:MAG: hypothetical protein VX589_03780 [Myxococcota bacterium]|nr:hypothetical protein [Myxococcota bacterium]
MNPRVMWMRSGLATVVLGVLLGGCGKNRADLEELGRTKNGDAKLAQILADPARPPEMRADASAILMSKGSLKELMAAITQVQGDQRKYLVRMLAKKARTYTTKQKFEGARKRAFEVGYYLLQYVDLLPKTPSKDVTTTVESFVGNLVNEAMIQLKANPENIIKDDVVQKFLIAAALQAPEYTLPELYVFLGQTAPDLGSFLYVNHVLSGLRDAGVKQKQAEFLLRWAKKVYPKVTKELAEQLYENRNETLLRFLLDAARDPRVPIETRNFGLMAAQILKRKALDGLFLLLQTDDPKNDNVARVNALNFIWDYGGQETLTRALQALPETGTWWPKNTRFRQYVISFCVDSLKDDADAIRPILETLIDDPNWVTRVYAMECLVQLFGVDALDTLEPLSTDDTVLTGWFADGPITIGEYVSGLSAE